MALGQPNTWRNGRYKGKGDPIYNTLIGEHAPPNSPFYYCPAIPQAAMLLDPSWYYASSGEGYNSANWTYTEVDGGADAVGAITVDPASGGLLFSIDDADNDLQQLQRLHNFVPAANAFAGCYFRVQASEATQSDHYLGFSSTDTSIVASAPADYAMFKKDDGDTIINGASNDAGGSPSETANLITDFTADTDYDLGIVLLPTSSTVGTMHFCYKLASATAWSMVSKTSDFPDAAVRLTMLAMRGTTGLASMTVKRWAYWAYAG